MTPAQLDQVQGFFHSIPSGREGVGLGLSSMGADTSPSERHTVTTKQGWLYLDDVLPETVLRWIDGTKDNHV